MTATIKTIDEFLPAIQAAERALMHHCDGRESWVGRGTLAVGYGQDADCHWGLLLCSPEVFRERLLRLPAKMRLAALPLVADLLDQVSYQNRIELEQLAAPLRQGAET